MAIESGSVYIAPGEQHPHIQKHNLTRWTLQVSREPEDHAYRPSVDVLFTTAAKALGQRVLGIVLTGIGEDGLRGGKDLKKAGGQLLAQSAETCIVYGMPRAVTEAGLVDASLSPKGIGAVLKSLAPRQASNAA
jgi:two-component system chemotaxis response regulator CheB